ncbi:mitochondrial chaperone BCS1 [Planococcus citri]|uniref:mitochondrial chaperone BCS1 n=1 Tax=Planococcus citri TaxID=170843 RepID=UPI0031F7952E
MPWTDFLDNLKDNQFFGAGFALVGVGVVGAAARKGMIYASAAFQRRYITTLEVPCRDKSYQWILQWITKKGARETQHLSVETSFEQLDNGLAKTKYDLIPSVGRHWFRHGARWILVERDRQQTMDLTMGMPFESVKLSTIGRNKQILLNILEEARHEALTETEGKTILYTAVGPEWRPFGPPHKIRPLSSVVLDEGVSNKILRDINEFIDKPSWYFDRGIPYRRGYLLHGPPGCGKSSFIKALAGELSRGICVLNLSERGLSDDRLNHLLVSAPQNSIILLEDVDGAFPNRVESPQMQTAYEGLSRLTMSGLLNSLDGVASAEGRILFMTTNHPERLDAALIRPGRVDLKQYVGYCTEYQIMKMYENFYQDSGSNAKKFAQEVTKHKRNTSPAELQGFFMLYKEGDLKALLENVPYIWEERKSEQIESNVEIDSKKS